MKYVCEVCGGEFHADRKRKYCTEKCKTSRINKICEWCNRGHFIAGGRYPSIDHASPVAKGGAHTWDNVRLAHRDCNSVKSDGEVYETGDGQMRLAI